MSERRTSDHHSHRDGPPPIYGIAAEFGSPEAVLAAAAALRPTNLGRLEIYSPVPIEGASAAIGARPRPIPHYMATGGVILGFALMMGMCIYATAYDYVFDIGGRPRFSWPAFAVPSVSFAMLTGALVVFFNMTFLCRLPMLNHPTFNIPGFLRATQDRFFLTVAPRDGEELDPGAVERALGKLASRPLAVTRVPR